jgi:uracil phosphoribosyltransferase
MNKVFVSDHPLVAHSLTRLRALDTKPQEFRKHVYDISSLLAYEATSHLTTSKIEINTPMGPTIGLELTEPVALVPVLRAGLGMVDGILTLIPTASVWHIGLKRDEDTLEPVEYYTKLPDDNTKRTCLLLDPMLATGGTASQACNLIKSWGAENIIYIGILAAPEGIQRLQSVHPDVPIYVGSIDSHLNDIGFIVPGLGDAGDRQFGT